jgi:hypothetical protein
MVANRSFDSVLATQLMECVVAISSVSREKQKRDCALLQQGTAV